MQLIRYVCVPSPNSHTGELEIQAILGDHALGFEYDLQLLQILLQTHFKSAEFPLDSAFLYSDHVLDFLRPKLNEEKQNFISLRFAIFDGKSIDIVDCETSLI